MSSFELLFMRHGPAEDFSPKGDAERALTDAGRRRIGFVAEAMSIIGLDWDVVVCSHLQRARQTAALMQDDAKDAAEIPTLAALAPSAPPNATIEALLGLRNDTNADRILAVGHNPNVTVTLGQLITRDPGVYFSVAPGDIAHLWIDLSPRGANAALLGFYPARALVSLLTA